MTVCENLIFNAPDVQFVHHRRTSALFSPPTVDIVYKSYSTPCWLPMVRSVLRPMDSVSTHESTDRILMATINDYLMDNYRPTKEYFSTLKDIQLFSTGSHCCAQLVSFWLRAIDSPWETNCTQHDSTDRYAIGITEVIRPVYIEVFRVGQWCYLTTGDHWKSQWAQRSPDEGTNSNAQVSMQCTRCTQWVLL